MIFVRWERHGYRGHKYLGILGKEATSKSATVINLQRVKHILRSLLNRIRSVSTSERWSLETRCWVYTWRGFCFGDIKGGQAPAWLFHQPYADCSDAQTTVNIRAPISDQLKWTIIYSKEALNYSLLPGSSHIRPTCCHLLDSLRRCLIIVNPYYGDSDGK